MADETTSTKRKRIGRAERELRISEVMRLLLEGQHRAEILQYIAKAGWGVSDRTVDGYIAQATAAIEAEATIDRAKEFIRHKQRLENLYAVTMKKEDYGNARLALDALSKLLSLNMPPAPQTLKLLGIDNAQLEMLIQTLHGAGLDPATVFDTMIAKAAEKALARKQDSDGR